MSHALEVEKLVKKGYKQAAFSQKSNALYFKHLWEQKGHKVEMFESSGPTLEHPNKRVIHAYYVAAKLSKSDTKKLSVVKGDDLAKKVINRFI